MKIQDINTKLFTNAAITDYGVFLSYFDEVMYNKKKDIVRKQYGDAHNTRLTDKDIKSLFVIKVHVMHNGSINIESIFNKHLDFCQCQEIFNIAKKLRGENEQ